MSANSLEMLDLLRSSRGGALLDRILEVSPDEAAAPRFVAALRRDWPADLVSLALRVAEARRRAGRKFPEAAKLWFTPELLEQASAHPCAAHRARRLGPHGPVLDLGCGGGGDLTRLAMTGAAVCGLERDALAAGMARANLEALELAGDVRQGEFPGGSLPEHRALFADPARRAAGGRPPPGSGHRGRHGDPAQFSPAPRDLGALLRRCSAWAIKWGPALDLSHAALSAPGGPLAGLPRSDYELELVSWRGQLLEAVLWGGDARRGEAQRASVLTGGLADFEDHAFQGDAQLDPPAVSRPRAWIVEVDPAILRAGLLAEFARRHAMRLLAPEIAYLTGDEAAPLPFGRSWPLLEAFPFSLQRLQEALDRHGAGELVIKKRGFPLSPEALRRRLRLVGREKLHIIIYRTESGHGLCLCGPPAEAGIQTPETE